MKLYSLSKIQKKNKYSPIFLTVFIPLPWPSNKVITLYKLEGNQSTVPHDGPATIQTFDDDDSFTNIEEKTITKSIL